MFDVIPQGLEEALCTYVKETYLPPRFGRGEDFNYKDLRFFAPAIETLSESFTSERAELPKNYFNKKEFRSSYLLAFFLTNYVKVIHCLIQLDLLKKLPSSGNIDILDLGAGPATAAIACAHYFSKYHPDCSVTIDAVEQNKDMAHDGKKLFKKLCSERHQLFIQEEIMSWRRQKTPRKEKKYDLVLAANILNEFESFEEQEKLCRHVIAHNLRGVFVIIDPALQKTTRNLMMLRDRLLAEKLATVLAPCLHQAGCPMLATNTRDWCHFYIEWKCPRLIRDIDRFTGNKHDYLKMAYMIFEGGGNPAVAPADTFRVVSSPILSKGKAELLLCGSNTKLQRITEFDRSRIKDTLPFTGSKRGDIVEWPGLHKKLLWNSPR